MSREELELSINAGDKCGTHDLYQFANYILYDYELLQFINKQIDELQHELNFHGRRDLIKYEDIPFIVKYRDDLLSKILLDIRTYRYIRIKIKEGICICTCNNMSYEPELNLLLKGIEEIASARVHNLRRESIMLHKDLAKLIELLTKLIKPLKVDINTICNSYWVEYQKNRDLYGQIVDLDGIDIEQYKEPIRILFNYYKSNILNA